MKRTLHYGTASFGIVGIVIYTVFAMVVKWGLTNRGNAAICDIIRRAAMWFMARMNVPLFQIALIAAGLGAMAMASLGLAAAKGRKAGAAGYCTGLGLVLFGAMLAVNGLMYRPFFATGEAMPGHSLYNTANIINTLLMLGVLIANAGGMLLGILGFMENKKRDTLLKFLLFSMAIVFAASLMWQLLWMVLAVMDQMLFSYIPYTVSLGAPYVLLAAVHVRAGLLEGRG